MEEHRGSSQFVLLNPELWLAVTCQGDETFQTLIPLDIKGNYLEPIGAECNKNDQHQVGNRGAYVCTCLLGQTLSNSSRTNPLVSDFEVSVPCTLEVCNLRCEMTSTDTHSHARIVFRISSPGSVINRGTTIWSTRPVIVAANVPSTSVFWSTSSCDMASSSVLFSRISCGPESESVSCCAAESPQPHFGPAEILQPHFGALL